MILHHVTGLSKIAYQNVKKFSSQLNSIWRLKFPLYNDDLKLVVCCFFLLRHFIEQEEILFIISPFNSKGSSSIQNFNPQCHVRFSYDMFLHAWNLPIFYQFSLLQSLRDVKSSSREKKKAVKTRLNGSFFPWQVRYASANYRQFFTVTGTVRLHSPLWIDNFQREARRLFHGLCSSANRFVRLQ